MQLLQEPITFSRKYISLLCFFENSFVGDYSLNPFDNGRTIERYNL